MIKAVWILMDIGPCLYRYAADERFLQTDENLISGFFVAMDTFARSVCGEEVLRIELKNLSLWFMKSASVIFVVAADGKENMTGILPQISRVYNEVVPDSRTSPYNPLIPSDVRDLEQKIDYKIKEIVVPSARIQKEPLVEVMSMMTAKLEKPRPTKQHIAPSRPVKETEEAIPEPKKPKVTQQSMKVTGEMIPKLQRSLTDVQRERGRLVKRFGVAAVDVLHYANGILTVSEIASMLKAERSVVEDVLDSAQKLGIVEFKQKE
jgi:hypothetical protein